MTLHQNELYRSGVQNLSAAMDAIQFNGRLTPDELENIRGHINDARSDFSSLSQVQPDNSGEFSALLQMADFLDKALNVADGHSHLV
jgi:hypothetical protein